MVIDKISILWRTKVECISNINILAFRGSRKMHKFYINVLIDISEAYLYVMAISLISFIALIGRHHA